MAAYPANCDIGKTYWHAPNFLIADWPVANAGGGNFTNPAELTLGGNSPSVVRTHIYAPGLTIKVQYQVKETTGSSVGGSVWPGGGCAFGNYTQSTDPFVSQPNGVSLIPHGLSGPQFAINDNIVNAYTSASASAGVTYSVIVDFTVSTAPVAGYWTLTIRLRVASLGIDTTYTDPMWQVASDLYGNFFLYGTTGASGTMAVQSVYMVGANLGNTCLGITVDPWPDAKDYFQGNPAACPLGKKTSWYLEEFDQSYKPSKLDLISGEFLSVKGLATLGISDYTINTLLLKWAGKLLNFSAGDNLSIEIRGRVDSINIGASLPVYDAFGIKAYLPDLSSYVSMKLTRDTSDPTLYKIATFESWNSTVIHTLSPAFVSYPLEVILRIDVYQNKIRYWVNGVLISEISVDSSLIPILYMVPYISCNLDMIHRGYLYYFYIAGSPGFDNLCVGTPTSRIVSYRNMLINLLPFGFPWQNLNTVFRLFIEAFAGEMDRLDGRSVNLLTEADPHTATIADLLSDWENMALLPEELPAGSETEAQRQDVVAAKVVTDYTGQSRQFFIDLAASFGITIEIQENGISPSSRTGTARTGTSRVGADLNIFVWNIRILTDPFNAVTTYWAYDGDQDLTTYPGSVTPRVGAFSTDLVFQGGPLFPVFPVVPLSASYPLKYRLQLRTFFYGMVNRSLAVITWAEAADFTTDFISFNFAYIPASPGYLVDLSGIKAGAGFSDSVTIPATHTDPLYGNFDILITISTTGFIIEIPSVGFIYTATGFVFPNIRYLDVNLQRADASNFAVLDGARVYTDAPNPSAPLTKFQTMVERLKPSHTQVTYT